MKFKKVILVVTALMMLLLFAGCGTTEPAPDNQEPQEPQQQESQALVDGDYAAYSNADPESKGEAKIQISVKDGKIADVKIEEIQDGSKGHAVKDLANYPHQPAVDGETYFIENFTGISTVEEVESVDDFAGITHSSEKFKLAAQRALIKGGAAEKTGTYFDGTFMGNSDPTAEKGFASAYVTIKNNAIESVVLQEWQPDKEKAGAFTLKDYANYPLEEAKSGNEYFTEEFVGAASAEDIDGVDDFAGVTSSSSNYKLAVKAALEKALQ